MPCPGLDTATAKTTDTSRKVMTSSQPNSWSTRMNLPPRWVKQPWDAFQYGQEQTGRGGLDHLAAGWHSLQCALNAGRSGRALPVHKQSWISSAHRALVAHVDVRIRDERHLEQHTCGARASGGLNVWRLSGWQQVGAA